MVKEETDLLQMPACLQGTNLRPGAGHGLAGGHTAAVAEITVEPRSLDCAGSSFESQSWQLIMTI